MYRKQDEARNEIRAEYATTSTTRQTSEFWNEKSNNAIVPPSGGHLYKNAQSLRKLQVEHIQQIIADLDQSKKMKNFTSIISALCLSISTLPFIQATPLESRATKPTPTRPFTVSAFQSPFPVGQGITGLNMTARDGNFYLSANGKPAVLSTDSETRAYLDSKHNQQIYLDTTDGHLGYGDHPPPGAVFVGFHHLGQGNEIFTQRPGFTSTAPGTFNWIGTLSTFWSACPQQNGDYQVFKPVNTFGPPDLSGCTVFSASALDQSG